MTGGCENCNACRQTRNESHIGSPCRLCAVTLTDSNITSVGPEQVCTFCAPHVRVKPLGQIPGVSGAGRAS